MWFLFGYDPFSSQGLQSTAQTQMTFEPLGRLRSSPSENMLVFVDRCFRSAKCTKVLLGLAAIQQQLTNPKSKKVCHSTA